MQLSQRLRTLKRTGSTAKASKCFGAVISSPEPPKETELCTLLYKPAKTCALFADSLAVSLSYRWLGRKPQWENFVSFLQCSMISDCPPGHASEVSKERSVLEENDFSCTSSWPLSRQVRTKVSTKRPDIDAWDCMHGLQPPAFRARWSSNLPHHSRSLPSSTFPFFSPPFSLALRACGGRPRTERSCRRLGCVLPRVHKNKSRQLHTMGSATAEFEVRHRWRTTTLFSGRYALNAEHVHARSLQKLHLFDWHFRLGLHFACTCSSKYSVHRWVQRSRINVFPFLVQTDVGSDDELRILPWQHS